MQAPPKVAGSLIHERLPPFIYAYASRSPRRLVRLSTCVRRVCGCRSVRMTLARRRATGNCSGESAVPFLDLIYVRDAPQLACEGGEVLRRAPYVPCALSVAFAICPAGRGLQVIYMLFYSSFCFCLPLPLIACRRRSSSPVVCSP